AHHFVSLPLIRLSPSPTLFPYTTLFRSIFSRHHLCRADRHRRHPGGAVAFRRIGRALALSPAAHRDGDAFDRAVRLGRQGLRQRSEEHTSELQSRENLVCRLLLEKKKTA